MSGILGFAADRPQRINIDRVQRALRSLEHRGCDDRMILLFDSFGGSSFFLDKAFEPTQSTAACDLTKTMLAGSRRLDEDTFSPPCGNSLERPNGRVFVVCDGVVDNSTELSWELQRLGRTVRSGTPSAILLAAFEEWGPACLSRIKGSFAFAAVDFQRGSLVLARDAFGTRPLYYSRLNGMEIFFASQIAALLELTSSARKVNRASLYRYLAHNTMDHDPETFFAGISQVSPGHYLEARLDKPSEFSVTCYRNIVSAQTKLMFNEAAQCLRELVVRSVTSQVGGRESIGAAHSGGFDSSFVIAAFERAHPNEHLQLYTCVPLVKHGEFSQSEEAWADLAATGFRSPVNKVHVSAKDLPGELDSIVCLQEEPFSSPVVFAQLQLFRAAQDHGVRMMFSGQGGDTMFASSTHQLIRAVLAHLRRGRWETATAVWRAAAQLQQGRFRQLARAITGIVLPGGIQTLAKPFGRRVHPVWLKAEWFELDYASPMRDLGLPMLRFEDRNSTACAILNRMPLLAVEIQDFVHSLPPEYLVTPDQPMKSIECAALRGLVPDAVLARKARSGFPVPVREWLYELAPWVETSMKEISCLPFLELRPVRQVWKSIRSQNASAPAAFLIWRWIFLCGWLRTLNIRLD